MTKPNRRRYPRFKIPALFRLKARVKVLGTQETHYFDVPKLSMGGVQLESKTGVHLDLKTGDNLEILLYSDHVSLKCISRVAHDTRIDTEQGEKKIIQAGVEIIGIDEKSRRVLADFIHKLSENPENSDAPSTSVVQEKVVTK